MTKTKATFMASFKFRDHFHPCKQIGDTVIVTLPRNRVARIDLTKDHGSGGMPTGGHWLGFFVRIIDKDKGTIDQQYFNWDQYLEPEGPVDKAHNGIEVIDYCGWDWYGKESLGLAPKSIDPIIHAIVDYIELMK